VSEAILPNLAVNLPVNLDEIAREIAHERDPLVLRQYILDVEQAMLRSAKAGIDGFMAGDAMPVSHDFADGVYLRELIIHKGTVLVGKIHKHEHFNFVMQGDISIVDERGLKRYHAPCIIKSPAGAKRLGYAHEDTIWINIHPTNERDIERIEQQVTAASYAEIGMEGAAIKQLGV
jgi:hypothetical protein